MGAIRGIGTRFQTFKVGGGPGGCADMAPGGLAPGFTPGGMGGGNMANSTAAPREPGGECADRMAQPESGMSTIAA